MICSSHSVSCRHLQVTTSSYSILIHFKEKISQEATCKRLTEYLLSVFQREKAAVHQLEEEYEGLLVSSVQFWYPLW